MPLPFNDRPRERESNPEVRERRRHKPTRSKRKSKSKEEIRDESPVSERKSFQADSSPQRKGSLPIPELGRRANSTSPNGSRVSLPYPSFSKEHSREAVGSKESLGTPPRKNVFTPDPTDLQEKKPAAKEDNTNRYSMQSQAVNINGPPSPPLTATESAAALEEKRQKLEKRSEDVRTKQKETKDNRVASGSQTARASPLSPVKKAEGVNGTRASSTGIPTKSQPRVASVEVSASSISSRSQNQSPSKSRPASEVSSLTASVTHSDSTSITPTQMKPRTPFSPDADDESSPTTASDSSLKTPTPRGTPFPATTRKGASIHTAPFGAIVYPNGESPMPPPPPPPPAPLQPSRVDYLMQNGGLIHSIPKSFITAANSDRSTSFSVGELPNPTAMSTEARKLFAPFVRVLEDYTKVMNKSGSVAVATGYKSIARRLLDRLEFVFSRDISSETCACVMCDTPDNVTLDDERGVNWGEILEFVSGRRELPQWPPFVLEDGPVGLGISAEHLKTPMQELDMDVPDQYRDHYIKQSKKTKESVDSWLAGQNTDSNAPEDADDDTLTFAILTHLEPERRPIFSQLLGIASSRPASIKPETRTHTPLNAPKSELITRTSYALQRLYRLLSLPRAPECAIYLLNNQHLHNVLATLAAVSDAEWDILVSGRFDGFLRSGAEDGPISQPPSRTVSTSGGRMSRGPTPLSTSSPAPQLAAGSQGAPVAMDEETEIAALGEVEREIFLGMEALEDAFEKVHMQAEGTRRLLRERAASLLMASQARRGAAAGVVEARLGTPASVSGWNSEGTDDGIDDALSELAPDDSASNYSRSRVRRPKRRVERRTPAPVEEESEDGLEGTGRRDGRERDREREKAPSRTTLWSRNSLRKR
ncbi:hypothetical protein MMC10_009942 [Thelotrema lepadinum]|nr:hypothetical protein [Thelotrema lepadinum]